MKAPTFVSVLLLLGVSLHGAIVFQTLHTFTGDDGAYPVSGLVQASNGVFYGTTSSGGTNGGYGTIFSITASGDFSSLYSFDYTNGAYPDAGMIFGSDGQLYGTTEGGGANGYGTVFKYDPSGSFTNLHSFSGTDGDGPEAPLLEGANGILYGTTYYGGTNREGNVFAITLNGTFTNLYSFDTDSGGYNPEAGLVFGLDGALYGTTSEAPTAFRITTNGQETTVWTFGPNFNGFQMRAPLTIGPDGSLYGELWDGSETGGSVFKIVGSVATNVYTFPQFSPYAGCPTGGLIVEPDNRLYGVAEIGGEYGQGGIFSVTTNGQCASLHTFIGYDGGRPQGPLVAGSNGGLYGTTSQQGSTNGNGCGTVFELTITQAGPAQSEQVIYSDGIISTIWSVQPGTIYQAQSSSNVIDWENFGIVTNAATGSLEVDDFTTNAQMFYRLIICP